MQIHMKVVIDDYGELSESTINTLQPSLSRSNQLLYFDIVLILIEPI